MEKRERRRRTRKDDSDSTTDSSSADCSTTTSSSASSRASSRNASREHTPKPLPKYQYDKDELMKIKEKPLSKDRPKCLNLDHDNPEGYWDPEFWFRSFDSSRGSSPLPSGGSRERKRPSELDKELVFKRKAPADPKARLREEEEDGLGIVLSPQRRSFGTGCHVAAIPQRRPPSPSDLDRDGKGPSRDRKGSKIGSGRLQISHDHHEREYRDREPRGRFDHDDLRPPPDRPNPLDRFRREDRDAPRDREGLMRDRDPRGGYMRSRDQDPRENDRGFGREYDRRYDNRNSNRGRRDYRHQEAEPEWFTGGPSSQSETIELHGFEGPSKENKRRENGRDIAQKAKAAGKEKEKEKPKVENPQQEMEEEGEGSQLDDTQEDRPSSRAGSLSVADRNGSLETNESSSPEISPRHTDRQARQATAESGTTQDFDFNEFFKIDNIPGLSDPVPVEQEQATVGGSRFSQWFHPGSHPSSRNDSRRSSINEEFSYLNDLLNLSGGQKSPIIPSPPLVPASIGMYSVPPHVLKAVSPDPQQQSHLLEMLHNATRSAAISLHQKELGIAQRRMQQPPVKPQMHGNAMAASEVEANLKALLMGGNQPNAAPGGNPHNQKPFPHLPPGVPIPGKVLTAAEFEASLLGGGDPGAKVNVGYNNNKVAPMVVNNTNMCWPQSKPTDHILPPPTHLPNSTVVLPSQGKVTTVSELEAGLKQLGLEKDAQAAAAITAANRQQTSNNMVGKHNTSLEQQLAAAKHNTSVEQLANKEAMGLGPQSPGDMVAFNKLLGMMKASGILGQETPRMPKKQEGRPVSPAATQQKDLIQKLIQHQQAKVIQQQQQTKLTAQQQQQVKQLAQQQQQKNVQDQILNFMKHNPGLLPKPATKTSPISPSLTLPPPASPRCPSPAIPQQALLQAQASPSPRAPSPIMFGSQPPLHLTAPSPIHPAQVSPSSPNTLQVNQGSNVRHMMQRVPSPQELIVHTQAIMQNALIKKQLEDQKERFLKKQQERAKSPNPMTGIANMTSMPQPQPQLPQLPQSAGASSASTSTPVINTKLTPAFTPTSVIRKMVNNKADKQNDSDNQQGSPEKKAPILKIMRSDSVDDSLNDDADDSMAAHQITSAPHVDTPPIMTVASDGSINIPVPTTPMASQVSANRSHEHNRSIDSTHDASHNATKDSIQNLLAAMVTSQASMVTPPQGMHHPQGITTPQSMGYVQNHGGPTAPMRAGGYNPGQGVTPPQSVGYVPGVTSPQSMGYAPGVTSPQSMGYAPQNQVVTTPGSGGFVPGHGYVVAPSAQPGSSQSKQPRGLFGQGAMNHVPLSLQQVMMPQVSIPQQSLAGQMPHGRAIVKGTPPQSLTSPPGQPRLMAGGSTIQQSPHTEGAAHVLQQQQQQLQQQQQQLQQQLQQQQQQQRPIVGGHQQAHLGGIHTPGSNMPHSNTTPTPPGGIRPTGGTHPPPSPNMPRASSGQYAGVPITGRVPVQAAGMGPRPGGVAGISPPTSSNPIMLQRMGQPVSGPMPTPPRGYQQLGMNQLSPLSALQAAQAQAQAQQRVMDPRLRNMYPPGGMPPHSFQAMSRALSPQPQMNPPGVPLSKQDGLNGSLSPGLSHANLNANLGALLGASGIDNNLAKWFGNDVLRHQGAVGPPLPVQGQKVMTVDEIERRQQMVTN